MKFFNLLAGLLLATPILARAAMIDLITVPAEGGALASQSPGANRPTILEVWFRNEHGKIESSIFYDVNGTEFLSSPTFVEMDWAKELPDVHYRILGYGYGPQDPVVLDNPVPQPVPIPGAVLLFGSAIGGVAMLRRRRGLRDGA